MTGRNALMLVLQRHVKSGIVVAFTLNLGTDSVKKTSYMSITIHSIDEKFNLNVRTLHLGPNRETSHTAVMVLDGFKAGLAVCVFREDVFDKLS
ncbi:unnamed protein product [Peronospora farinosa]|uniref:Uncharacterized protein n=1 Tax=Peronospora farinosa TaxID=134698 RepID=A0AAV0TCN5_9STRA|nr:unnamed protein product [Peronospora farinosa]CAI5719498.1 unnamed protein product [Peronospora farinosa]